MKKIFITVLALIVLFCFSVFANAESEKVNPEDFGAVGDGITDDTTAFYNALLSGKTVSGKDGSIYKLNTMEIRKNIPFYIENCNVYVESRNEWSCIIDFIYSADIHFENCNFKTEADKIPCETIAFYMEDTESPSISNVCFIRSRNLNGYDYNLSLKNCTFENSGMDIITKSNIDKSAGQIDIENCKSINSVNAFSISNAKVYNISDSYFYEHREGNRYAHPLYFGYGAGSECNVRDTYIDFCSSGGIQCYHASGYTLNMNNVTMVNGDEEEFAVINNTSENSKTYMNNCKINALNGMLLNIPQVADESTYHEVKNSTILCKGASVYNSSKENKNTNMCFESCNITFKARGIYGNNNTMRNCNIRHLGNTDGYTISSSYGEYSGNSFEIDTERSNPLRFTGNVDFKNNSVVFGGVTSPATVVYATGENNFITDNNFYSWSNHRISGGTSTNNTFDDTANTNILEIGRLFCSTLKKENEVFFDNEDKKITAIVFGKSSDYSDICKNYSSVPIDVGGNGKISMYTVPDCNGISEKIYIISDEPIYLNPSVSDMFNNFKALKTVIFENVDFSLICFSADMWKGLNKLEAVYTSEKNPVFESVSPLLTVSKPSVSQHVFKTKTTLPTCTEDGTIKICCEECGAVEKTETIPAKGHIDDDSDGVCDTCGFVMIPTLNCSCRCHKTGFDGFIWKIINFFNRIFKKNTFCDCGIRHY